MASPAPRSQRRRASNPASTAAAATSLVPPRLPPPPRLPRHTAIDLEELFARTLPTFDVKPGSCAIRTVVLTPQAVAVATCASGCRFGDAARCRSMAVVARASVHRRREIGQIVAVSVVLYPAVTVLQNDEAGVVGGWTLVGVDATAGCRN